MSQWKTIKDRIYVILESIAKADGYNYDWMAVKRIDKYIPTSEEVTATIHTPEDATFSTEIIEESTTEYKMMLRTFEIKARVVSKTLIIKSMDVIDENDEAIDDMLEDLNKALFFASLNRECIGVAGVENTNAEKESITSKSVYYPFLLNAEYQIKYKESR